MKIKALTSFVGEVSMGPGEVMDVPDEVAKNLIDAGYAASEGKEKPAEKPVEKPAKAKTTKK